MRTINQEFEVRYRYPVHFTTGLFDRSNPLLVDTVADAHSRRPVKELFVIDRNLCIHWPNLLDDIGAYLQCHSDRIVQPMSPLLVPGGEMVKNDPVYTQQVQAAINQAGICRHSYVIAVGGGAVLDMVGYAAATAHRGVRLLRVPTTVLSQNDSAVGVKNGINAFGKKNFLGAFAPPSAVLNDSQFLTSLSSRDWCGGISEAIKVALIKEELFFNHIESHAADLRSRQMEIMEEVIYHCARLHVEHISGNGDPFESGSSRPLDFGHWAAHKLEQLTCFEMRHGEAVGIGIALDATYSHLAGFLPKADWLRIIRCIQSVGLDIFAPELCEDIGDRSHPGCLLRGLDEFREHLGGELTIMLLRTIGRGVEVHSIDEEAMEASIAELKQMAGRPQTANAINGRRPSIDMGKRAATWRRAHIPAQ